MNEKEEIRKRVEKGKIKEAIDLLGVQKKNIITYTLLKFQFSNLERQWQLGIITHDEYNTIRNKIAYKLLNVNKVSRNILMSVFVTLALGCLMIGILLDTDEKVIYGRVIDNNNIALKNVIIKPINFPGQQFYSNAKGEFLLTINSTGGDSQYPVVFDLAGYKSKLEYISLDSEEDSIKRLVTLERLVSAVFIDQNMLFERALDSVSRKILLNQLEPLTARIDQTYNSYNSENTFHSESFQSTINSYEDILKAVYIIKEGYNENSTLHLYMIMYELIILKNISDTQSSAWIHYRRATQVEKAEDILSNLDQTTALAIELISKLENIITVIEDKEEQENVIRYWKLMFGI